MEHFAQQYERLAVLGLHVRPPSDPYQIAKHYLDEMPDAQKVVYKALNDNMYQIDYFLSEADTLIVKDKIGINLCSHDAYGIDTVRYPLWFVYWNVDRDDQVVREFTRHGVLGPVTLSGSTWGTESVPDSTACRLMDPVPACCRPDPLSRRGFQ